MQRILVAAAANLVAILASRVAPAQAARPVQDRRQAEGRAERPFLEKQAAGQSAQAEVPGKDNALRFQEPRLTLDLLAANPEIVANLKLPQAYVGAGARFFPAPPRTRARKIPDV